MKIKTFFFKTILLIAVLVFSCEKPIRDLHPETLVEGFELLSAESTGIDFSNTINESTYFNHYYYSHIYNGSGVAIGDINNDGLSDIFFGGNQVSDRLYLNKGNFKFENITKKSRTAKNSGWTWGVTMADVNADGYLDIYVSRNGNSLKLEDCRNQLYINNQDLTFTESALAYGLADVGFSSQAVFFDMDNDGDLDMYQVNQLPDARLFSRYANIPKKREVFYKDKLYKNEGGKYKDVSEEVGISRDMTYGLSVSASDFNNDGWTDLYVANDYDKPDALYYNNGDGSFRNVIDDKLKHISQFSMGTDTGDINNDGLIDLVTLDMASMNSETFKTLVNESGSYQYMTNTLQINSGLGMFSDVANLSGISNTDWSWASLIVDLDNDGWKDILVTNGIKKDFDNNDYRKLMNSIDSKISAKKLFEYSKNTPSKPVSNYAFKNTGNLKFEKVTKEWGFDTPSFSSGMAYGDLDNDGDLDVVVNNMENAAFVFKNNATGNFLKINLEGTEQNKFGYGVKAIIHYKGQTQIAENTVTRGYFSSVESGLFFGLGKETELEKVEVFWADGKSNVFNNVKANRELIAKYAKAEMRSVDIKPSMTYLSKEEPFDIGLNFRHKENDFDEFQEEILLPHNISQNGPFMAIADVNGDGLEDLFFGGAVEQSGVLYIQNQKGSFGLSTSQPWEMDKASEDLEALFLDVDGDGDNDLYVASGGSEYRQGNVLLKDRLYLNNGIGEFTKNNKALPNIYESSQAVKASDIDKDGDLDLFVGTRLISGKYGFPASSYLLINDNGTYEKASKNIAPDLRNIGMVTDAAFTDIDKDGDQDLMIVGEWMEIEVLENNGGIFTNSSEKFGVNDTRGIWWSISVNDIDGDGDDDYIIGNLGVNNKFKASKEHPFKVYVNDFDNNGTNDVVLAKFYKDDYVPVRGRECTSQQMPYVAEKFKDYHSFASSKLLDILPEDKVDNAVIYEINNFESIILINEDGKLKRKSLPIQAQISPVKSSLVDDFNTDGFKDILIVGNHYGVEVETTRYDAGYGSLLLGDGNNNFNVLPPTQSGFYAPLDSRIVQPIKINESKAWLITNNNDALSMFKLVSKQ